MNRIGLGAIAAVFATVMLTAGADTNQDAERLLKAATNTELVDGNLKSAIEQYKRVVDVYGKTDRAAAAQALVRMAECYQKLGDAQSRGIYERVIRDYADQKEPAALAHARLGTAEPAGMTSRRITSVPVGGAGYGTVSPDGRYFPYTNWNNGDLYLRDFVTGADRRLTNVSALNSRPSQFAVQAAFSKDGSQVAYGWVTEQHAELRVVESAGAGVPQPRRLFDNDDIAAIWPDDWSADGRWLAVQLRRRDKTAQIGLVRVQDGSLRVLKSVDWRGATRLMFSPDAKYLAYDLPAGDIDNQRDVFILAVDGSRDVGTIVHPGNDTVMGWSTNGSRLLFASDRTGSIGLWQLAVTDGRPQGMPDLIKSNVEGAPLGIARNGSLYSLVHHPRFNAAVSSNILVAPFDFGKGAFLSRPVALVQSFVGTNSFPVWSPDGKRLAYMSRREEATGNSGTHIAVIREMETGQVRELRPPLNLYPPVARWSADGLSLLTHGRDVKGRQGLYRIEAQTGTVSVIALSSDDSDIRSPVESPDGRTIYFMRGYVGQPEREFAVIERDLLSGSERELIRGRSILAPNFAALLSPDGHWIIVSKDDPTTRSASLLLVPARGGEPRELIRVDSPRRVGLQSWTPDSRAILVTVADIFQVPGVSSPGAVAELWRVPLDGSERRKLDLNVAGMTPFSVHPDGRQIGYALTERAKDDEVWVLENFLPRQTAKK